MNPYAPPPNSEEEPDTAERMNDRDRADDRIAMTVFAMMFGIVILWALFGALFMT